ncbi:MAG: ABC transporter ATP-binding protein [Candidatus Faecousia sp.]|nr:ABC transporter ATP-binding protein [Candidatus Faecousia sp.]
MEPYFKTEDLAVGYDGKALIHHINILLEKGKILTLVGPNGGGKSTILKSITRHLQTISGRVFVGGQDLRQWQPRQLARQVAVVLTERVRPELTTCAQVVAMGRYPYTGVFGRLSDEDRQAVYRALERVHALDLAQRDFASLSDGQRQRILLARALCQEPEVIVLDEPTAYLDIHYKIELLEILREMAQEQGITVLLSLHEIDLAAKVSDYLLCVRGETVAALGTPEQVLQSGAVESLYSMERGSYNGLLGSVELPKPSGEPRVFVVAGGGWGIPVYRRLQKQGIPFATGILFENDVDFQVAQALSSRVISTPAFEEISQSIFEQAAKLLKECTSVIDAGTPVGRLNEKNGRLLSLARQLGLPVTTMKESS